MLPSLSWSRFASSSGDRELAAGDPVPDVLRLRRCRGVKRRYVAPSTAAMVSARFSIVTWPRPIRSTAATSRDRRTRSTMSSLSFLAEKISMSGR